MLALVVGVTERARIKEALRDRATVHFFDRVAQVERFAVNPGQALVGLIVESHDLDGHSSVDLIRMTRSTQPSIPIIGYCRAGIAHSSDVRALAAAGVHELLFHGIDDTGTALRMVLAMAKQASVAEAVSAVMVPLVPERSRPFVRHVISNPVESQRVTTVARALGLHRKTLVNHCAQGRLPPPQEMIAWCRLAVIGYLLGSSRCTVEAIAMQLDFASDTALRNFVKRYVGMRATDVRALGGLSPVICAFERALLARRTTARATG